MLQLRSLIDDAIDADTAFVISTQLSEHGLINWQAIETSHIRTGMGRITASGVAVIEGRAKSPIAISISDHRVQISNSSSVQVGGVRGSAGGEDQSARVTPVSQTHPASHGGRGGQQAR